MKAKKILKITAGIIVFLTLPTLLLFGFLYLKYDEDLPTGTKGIQAEQLATEMLNALNFEAYKNTDYIEWTFKNRHHYKWKKNEGTCTVYWEDYKVILNFKAPKKNKTYVHNFEVTGEQSAELIEKATKFFNNDSFWLVAPYKVFDEGTERSVVTLEKGKKSLLVTYTSGGSTPGDSYLWHLDKNGKPISFQIWADILPIGGLKATWNHWTTTESGAQLPTFHKMMVFGLEITDIKGIK
ncbi:MAG: hypothetical protein R2797_09220 [Gelidibacter sp.]